MFRMKKINNRSLIKRLMLLVLAGVFSLALLEIMIRVLLPRYSPAYIVRYYVQDSGLVLGAKSSILRHRVNWGGFDVEVRFNEFGLRDTRDFSDATARDYFVVGDSFSFGHGVEENERYSNQLDLLLAEDVYNISIPTDIVGYEKLIQHATANGATISNLIVGVCMENDIRDYDHPVAMQKSKPPSQKSLFARLKDFLYAHSATYNAFSTRIHSNKKVKRVLIRLGMAPEEGYSQVPVMVYSKAVVESSANEIEAMVLGYSAVILVIPSRALWIGANQEKASLVHAAFVRNLRDRGLSVVDPMLAFESGGRPLQYYFRRDGHWNRRGHKLVAQEIAAFMNADD